MSNILDGWKKLLMAGGGLAGLGLDAIPDNLVWPYTVVLAAYLIGQSIADFAKAWKAGK